MENVLAILLAGGAGERVDPEASPHHRVELLHRHDRRLRPDAEERHADQRGAPRHHRHASFELTMARVTIH